MTVCDYVFVILMYGTIDNDLVVQVILSVRVM